MVRFFLQGVHKIHMFSRLFPVLLFTALVAATPAPAAPTGSGKPLPRFVSLRAGEVNLRTGPGVQYPVDWVYHRKGLPMEVVAEYDTWRKVRDWQGTQGWVHQSMLSRRRTVVITGSTRTLRADARAESPPVARAEASVVSRLLLCPNGIAWCQVEVDGFKGWVRRMEIWGLHRNEIFE